MDVSSLPSIDLPWSPFRVPQTQEEGLDLTSCATFWTVNVWGKAVGFEEGWQESGLQV